MFQNLKSQNTFNSEDKPAERILPDIFYSARSGLVFFLLPQILFFLYYLNSFRIIAGDLDSSSLYTFIALGVMNFALIIFALFVSLSKNLSALKSLGIFFVLLVYSAIYVPVIFSSEISSTISPWIFSIFTYVFNLSLSVCIPAAFYGIRTSAFESKLTLTKNFVISLGLVVGCPICLYWFSIGFSKIGDFLHSLGYTGILKASSYIIIPVIAISVFIVYCAICRILVLIFGKIVKGESPLFTLIMKFLFGAILPLGCFIIFFSKNAYLRENYMPIMAIIFSANFLMLILPKFKNAVLGKIQLFLWGIVYLFLSYFMLLTLPLLPISIFAIFVGVGAIFVTPFILWILATLEIVSILKAQASRFLAYAALIFGMLLPIFAICAQAYYYRIMLANALEYTSSTDTSKPRTFTKAQAKAALNGAKWFLDFKYGNYYPYFSALKMEILCDSMVVKDSKIARIFSLFSNESIEDEIKNIKKHCIIGNSKVTSFANTTSARTIKAVIKKSEFKILDENSAKLTLNFAGAFNSEFVGEIQIPDGVFVKGMAFEVKGKLKPAKIFEKKAAIWTYQNIVNESRDPAIVYYASENVLSVRAFPINTPLKMEIDFEKIGGVNDIEIVLEKSKFKFDSNSKKAAIISNGKSASAIILNRENFSNQDFCEFENLPIVIFDMSDDGAEFEDAQKFFEELSLKNPEINKARVYLSNLNFKSLGELKKEGKTWNLENIKGEFESFARIGGFDCEFAKLFVDADIKKIENEGGASAQKFDIFCVSNSAKACDFKNPLLPLKSLSGISLKIDAQVLNFYGNNFRQMRMLNSDNIAKFEILKDGKWTDFKDFEISENPAVDVWAISERMRENPSLKKSLYEQAVQLSKAQNTLACETSLIVVETSSQQEIMKLAEKKVLNSGKDYDLSDDTQTNMPEPSEVFAMISALIAIWAANKIVKKLRAN